MRLRGALLLKLKSQFPVILTNAILANSYFDPIRLHEMYLSGKTALALSFT